MDDISGIFSQNLRKLREDKKLSLDEVSRLCGVSKSMLGQIERGITSPTISTVWKITNGLKIVFTDLMTAKPRAVEVVKRRDMTPLLDCHGKYRNYPLFPFSADRPFEIYTIEMDPGAFLAAEAHPPGTEEFVCVSSGTTEIAAGEETWLLETGDTIHFRADRKHSYRCLGDTGCVLGMVIYYAGR